MFKHLFIVCVFVFIAFSDNLHNELLFTIKLTDSTSSDILMRCFSSSDIGKTVAGPVVYDNDYLLFYSPYGYVLYDKTGKVIEKTDIQNNRIGSLEEIKLLGLAGKNLVFFLKGSNEKITGIYVKKNIKSKLKKFSVKDTLLIAKLYNISKIRDGFFVNILNNVITDDLASKFYLYNQMVGFDAFDKAKTEIWTLEREFGFLSPFVIYNTKSGKIVFFNGSRSLIQKKKLSAVDPIGITTLKKGNIEEPVIFGVHSYMGDSNEKYFQYLYCLDRAGNVVFKDTLLKQRNSDVIIGEDRVTYYTIKKLKEFSYMPSIDNKGNIYYGKINFVTKDLNIYRIKIPYYTAVNGEKSFAHLIDIERSIQYTPVDIRDFGTGFSGSRIPDVTFINEKGIRVKARIKDLKKNGYILRIYKLYANDLVKLAQKNRYIKNTKLNTMINNISETISEVMGVSLSGKNGMLTSFNYPSGEKVLCARILSVRDDGIIVCRIDLENYAEIVLFDKNGNYIDEFIFNTQNYKARKDILVSDVRGDIIEVDYEKNQKPLYLKWIRKY